jgi:hypothetical protein
MNCRLPFVFVAAALALTGCKEEEDRGVSRISGLSTSAENASAQATPPPVSGNHQAPPLSELTNRNPHGTMAPSTTGTAGANDPNMMIQAGETKVMQGGNILQAAGLAFTVSEDWKNVKPSTSMRVAEYELGGSAGPAEMAVFYFGRNQGGGIEDNIRRWAGQFTPDSNTTQTGAQVARVEKDDLRIAMVKTEGTYDPGSMGPMGPANTGPKPDYALFGVVVEGGPEGSLFIKVTGPKQTLAEQNEALETFAKSVRVSSFQ